MAERAVGFREMPRSTPLSAIRALRRPWIDAGSAGLHVYSRTRVGVSRKQCIQVDATIRKRRPRIHSTGHRTLVLL
jgi:hypothetical protein